ncbi:uncharacterized protein TNCV_4812721 [Trichonephila clavipes]|nr:uncharacterized protein TNCV_4812721 [Trichonephila clavipes]
MSAGVILTPRRLIIIKTVVQLNVLGVSRNSDLAPSDFHVFLHLKKFLFSGERFGDDEELKTSVTHWFRSQAAEFYDRVIQKLILRFDKCINSGGS